MNPGTQKRSASNLECIAASEEDVPKAKRSMQATLHRYMYLKQEREEGSGTGMHNFPTVAEPVAISELKRYSHREIEEAKGLGKISANFGTEWLQIFTGTRPWQES